MMTPCDNRRRPNFNPLVEKGLQLIEHGMSGVVYCGSMGDWPLLTDVQRMEGVSRLVEAGVPVIVGTGAINSQSAAAHAAHAQKVGANGLMVIPRVLSRGNSIEAQRLHFKAILNAAPDLPAVIYNSPYYGFATRADLFFALRGWGGTITAASAMPPGASTRTRATTRSALRERCRCCRARCSAARACARRF